MRRNDSESGWVIVEASIVFPVMFLVIFLMIYMGNAYYLKAKIESIVNECALDQAAYCADTMLSPVEKDGKVPDLDANEIEPYRYLLGGLTKSSEYEEAAKSKVEEELSSVGSGFFKGMKPQYTKGTDLTAKYQSYIIYSTFTIDLSYTIVTPIRFWGFDDNFAVHFASHAEVPVSDVPEFVRTVDMAEDYMDSTGLTEKIAEAIDKVKSMFSH